MIWYDTIIDCGKEYIYYTITRNAFDKGNHEYIGKVIHEDDCPLIHKKGGNKEEILEVYLIH